MKSEAVNTSAAAFLLHFRRRAVTSLDIANPVQVAQIVIASSGDMAEGALLRRIFRSVATGEGEYREAEIYLLSDYVHKLASALIDVRDCGLYSGEEWKRMAANLEG